MAPQRIRSERANQKGCNGVIQTSSRNRTVILIWDFHFETINGFPHSRPWEPWISCRRNSTWFSKHKLHVVLKRKKEGVFLFLCVYFLCCRNTRRDVQNPRKIITRNEGRERQKTGKMKESMKERTAIKTRAPGATPEIKPANLRQRKRERRDSKPLGGPLVYFFCEFRERGNRRRGHRGDLWEGWRKKKKKKTEEGREQSARAREKKNRFRFLPVAVDVTCLLGVVGKLLH